MESVEYRLQAGRHPHRLTPGLFPPAWPATLGSNIKDKAVRREQEMAILRQRVEFDWPVLGAPGLCRFSSRGS
jgi:hypothetical protein